MEYMEGGSLYEWLHFDLDIGWDVRLRYDKTQSTPHSPPFNLLISAQ